MRRLTMLLLLTTLFAACGGDDDDDVAPATTTTDGAPEVVAAEDVACPFDASMVNAVTGLEVADPDPVIPTGDGVSCTFGVTGGDTGISVTTYGSSTASVAMEKARDLLDDAEDVTIEWADEAIWSPGLTTLHVVAGDRGAQVQISDFGGAITDPQQVATELAEIAVG